MTSTTTVVVAVTDTGLLGNRYELGEVLGYGGMAEVRHGRDLRLDREVAVKTLRPDLARDPTFQNRFRREAQSAASLNHPAIVAVYDTGEEGGAGGVAVPYIVMEYVHGRTLREVLDHEGRLLPHRALEILADVLQALDYSHQHGIIHRDIKPGNVMLTRTGDVKVMDFGIARALTAAHASMTQTATVIGTAHYLSPEQARGEHVDARSDIYSAGCLLYELLTGTPPFTGDTPVSVAYQHVRENPIPPSEINPEVSPAIDSIVMKALAKNPANRYQSAAEMCADIERALTGRAVLATPLLVEDVVGPAAPTTTQQVVPASRRRQALGYLLLAILALIVLVTVAFVTRSLIAGDVSVPNVQGKPLASAERALTQAGLQVGHVRSEFDAAAKNTVIRQSPLPMLQVSKGSRVNLVVSRGIQYVRVPPLLGLSLAEARTVLTADGLTVGRVTRQNVSTRGTVPNPVLKSVPTQGTRVRVHTSVSLVVASNNVQVPNVFGYPQAVATQVLQQSGFRVTVLTQRVNSPSSYGDVVFQSPVGGGYAPAGSAVTITIGTAPPSPSASPSSPSASPSPSASSKSPGPRH
jgi:serine/threonine-protein kinase